MRLILLAPMALLSACATMIEGTSDNITVTTTPAGAMCTIDREGQRVGAVAATPASIRINKSRRDLSVTCGKEGYVSSTIAVEAGFTGTTFANILLGGVVGVVVDAASGANSRYPADIRVDLAEMPRPAAAPMQGQVPAGMPQLTEAAPLAGV